MEHPGPFPEPGLPPSQRCCAYVGCLLPHREVWRLERTRPILEEMGQ